MRRSANDGARGQSLVEFALIFPVACFVALGFLEAGFLLSTKVQQDRSTGVVADWLVAHPSADPAAVVAGQGLGDCTVGTAEASDVVTVTTTCHYEPVAAHGLWEGLPITSEASAAEPVVTVLAEVGTPEASDVP